MFSALATTLGKIPTAINGPRSDRSTIFVLGSALLP